LLFDVIRPNILKQLLCILIVISCHWTLVLAADSGTDGDMKDLFYIIVKNFVEIGYTVGGVA